MAHITIRIKLSPPESTFDKTLEEELLRAWLKLADIINGGITFADNFEAGQGNHIADADGTLPDLTTKFNTLLARLEAVGLLKSS